MVTPGYIPPHPNPSKPKAALPAGACDSHCHVFGPADRYPFSPKSSYIPPDAPAEDLAALHAHLGFERAVLVQASCHGTDNSAMVDALRGRDNWMGIAILDGRETDAQLAEMHEVGVRGVRFNFVPRLKAAQPLDECREIVRRIEKLGWHLIVYLEPPALPGIIGFLHECPVPVAFDHMGLVPVEEGTEGEAFGRLAELLRDDRFWVKISGAERVSRLGPPYTDVDPIARELLRIAPDRVLFGTDWPHPNMTTHAPDDGKLVDRLVDICDADQLRKALVDNPTRLYFA
jgi:2-pyrone-4,6-dicarboxylate lactonase